MVGSSDCRTVSLEVCWMNGKSTTNTAHWYSYVTSGMVCFKTPSLLSHFLGATWGKNGLHSKIGVDLERCSHSVRQQCALQRENWVVHFDGQYKTRCYLHFSRKSVCLKIQERNKYSLLPCYPAIKKLLLELLNRSLMIGTILYSN